jgi:hypothetical protein
MRIPCAVALSLPWVLLLSSTVGLVAHEHFEVSEQAGHECTVDHHGEAGALEHPAEAHIEQSGVRHRHECVGCKLNSSRSLLDLTCGGLASRLPSTAASPLAHAEPHALVPLTGRTLRGPPAV